MKIALVGNQNSGKTTLFNCLTGMNAKIGNWPGVTIEKKIGKIKGTNHELIDLPGIYSLSPYTIEEEVARNFIFEEKPDVIINIVDATALERSLYLTTQLLELDCRVIIALNMSDMLLKKGLTINTEILSGSLGANVVKISALKETGINELIKLIDDKSFFTKTKIFDLNIENIINYFQNKLPIHIIHKRFISVKMLEEDKNFKNYLTLDFQQKIEILEQKYDTDLEEIIATQRYNFIELIKERCIIQKLKKETYSDKLDKIFLNKFAAFPIFIIIMFLIYYLSVGVIGSAAVEWTNKNVELFSNWIFKELVNLKIPIWLISLIVNGIIKGVGAVLGFIPELIILFVCISILETSGYMSRIALFLDKFFRNIGLSGKSLIPFIIGSGCSVPGIIGTRIIENQHERKVTAILTPFIPCSAKLPIIALFSGYFFGEKSGFVSASLYLLAICIIILSSILMKKFVYKYVSNTYVLELPEYKLPDLKYVFRDVLDKVISFIKRAGSVILVCSIILWFLLSFSYKLEYGVDIENSILAIIGKLISWIFYPILGVNSWQTAISAIQGLVAKEQVISSMSVIAGLADVSGQETQMFAEGSIFDFFTVSSAYAFMVFNLFSAPCFGAIGAMKRELGSYKAMFKAISFQTILAWCLATFVYQIGIRFETGVMNIPELMIISGIILGVVAIVLPAFKIENVECLRCPYCEACNKK